MLFKNGITTQTHAVIKQMLGLHFVLTGKLSSKDSSVFATLFEKRHSSDYDDFAFYDRDTVEQLLPHRSHRQQLADHRWHGKIIISSRKFQN